MIALGFQVCDGKLGDPVDLFDDPAFDYTRQKAQKIADYMRRRGPFEPHTDFHWQIWNTPRFRRL